MNGAEQKQEALGTVRLHVKIAHAALCLVALLQIAKITDQKPECRGLSWFRYPLDNEGLLCQWLTWITWLDFVPTSSSHTFRD